jgi:hypothetical protein
LSLPLASNAAPKADSAAVFAALVLFARLSALASCFVLAVTTGFSSVFFLVVIFVVRFGATTSGLGFTTAFLLEVGKNKSSSGFVFTGALVVVFGGVGVVTFGGVGAVGFGPAVGVGTVVGVCALAVAF